MEHSFGKCSRISSCMLSISQASGKKYPASGFSFFHLESRAFEKHARTKLFASCIDVRSDALSRLVCVFSSRSGCVAFSFSISCADVCASKKHRGDHDAFLVSLFVFVLFSFPREDEDDGEDADEDDGTAGSQCVVIRERESCDDERRGKCDRDEKRLLEARGEP